MIRKYAKCELDEIAIHCGMRQAEDYRRQSHDESASLLDTINCRLGILCVFIVDFHTWGVDIHIVNIHITANFIDSP